MLYSLRKHAYINQLPFKAEYDLWKSKISPAEFDAIMGELHKKIDEAKSNAGKEILTAGWIPGKDWSGTVYDPIYMKCCDQDERQAALCFGLFCFSAFLERPNSECWVFDKFELNGKAIGSNTYFLTANPPQV